MQPRPFHLLPASVALAALTASACSRETDSARLRPVLAAILVAALGVSGCGQDGGLGDSYPWTGTMEERDGAIWVTNPTEPLWPDDGTPRIEFELEQVFGADEAPLEATLAAVRSVTVDDAGHVYVLDHEDRRLVAFDAAGELLWNAGRPGEGPSELQQPRAVIWNGGDLLYVANQSGTRIDTWSVAGQYLDSLLLAALDIGRLSNFGFVSPDTIIVLSEIGAQAEAHTLRTGEGWEIRGSFTMAASSDFELPGRIRLHADSRLVLNGIIFGNLFNYEFRIFLDDGRLDRVISRPQTGFVGAAIDMERGTVGLFTEYLRAPVRLQDNRWLAQAAWPTNISDPVAHLRRAFAGDAVELEFRHTLDLFDAEGRWLTGRVWDHPDRPPFGTIEMLGPDGSIYTSMQDPFPQVRRYQLVVRPPG